MNLLEAIALGLVQGLTEFIPISSSGHLVLVQYAFGNRPDHLLVEFVNAGTVLALIIYFWPRIKTMLKQVFIEKNWQLARNITIAALPAGVFGFVLADVIEHQPFFANPWVVAATLFIVGVLLILLEKLPKLTPVKDGEALNSKRALGIGFAQALALIPGTSRSGATIIAGRIAGLSAAAAAEFSFLLSIPIMLGVLAKLLLQPDDMAYFADHLQLVIVANVVAFASGLLAVSFLMKYLAKHTLAVFGWYRISLAIVVVGLLLLQ